jgi:predicted Zn-dependent protease with MMP-like domain
MTANGSSIRYQVVDADNFQAMAEAAYAALPANFVAAIENVVVLTDDYPDAGVQLEMRTHSPLELLGLYQGWPLPERGSSYGGHPPDVIHLYREPILAYCREHGEDVTRCIRHVLIHEIGHYFGFSDAEMEAIDRS